MNTRLNIVVFLTLCALGLSMCGCVHTECTGPNGIKYSRTAFLSPTSLSDLTISGTEAKLSGYKSETAQIVSEAIRAGLAAAKP